MPKGVKGFTRADGRRTKKEAAVLREEERVASAGGEEEIAGGDPESSDGMGRDFMSTREDFHSVRESVL